MRRVFLLCDRPCRSGRARTGKILVLCAVLLPALIAVAGLVVDTGVLMANSRDVQNAADAAATAAARALLTGSTEAAARTRALDCAAGTAGSLGVQVTVNIPPSQGTYAGVAGYVEVIARRAVTTYITHGLGSSTRTLQARSVAGSKAVTAGAAIVVLDPRPPLADVPLLGYWTAQLPSPRSAIEIAGPGRLEVDGAVLANTRFGGADANGLPVGIASGPPYGLLCSGSRLKAEEIRICGGVSDVSRLDFDGTRRVLQAGRLPVADPLQSLPLPTTTTDVVNVTATYRGTRTVTTGGATLLPGVYDWIDVAANEAVFQPGVYILRGVNPLSGLTLKVRGDRIRAEGVMFYITDSATYSAVTGAPDADREPAPWQSVTSQTPSVWLEIGWSSRFQGISDTASPFNRVLLFQARHDRRPLYITKFLGGDEALVGIIYAKSARAYVIGGWRFDARFAVGSLTWFNLFDSRVAPAIRFPGARDVFLVE